MKIVNCTPHPITLLNGSNSVTIEPAARPARCTTTRQVIGVVEVGDLAIPINRTIFGQVEGLPEPKEETIYLVSSIVAQAVPERADVYIIDDTVRDSQGRIVGACALARIGE